ncbi:MAG: NAD(P)-dependent oxidoreductase [Betaproteobacteria bacterium]
MTGKILITGGAGFLGRHLARHYADLGWRVTVLDDLSCSNSAFDFLELQHPQIDCIEASIFDEPTLRGLVSEHEVIVHLASVVGVGKTIDCPVETARNLVGTLHLVNALTSKHTVLFGSSADVYGMHSTRYEHPMREDDDVVFEHAMVNRWVYPKVKSLEENLIASAPSRSAIVRIFNSFGPWMDYPNAKRVIPQFMRAIERAEPIVLNGDGLQCRCFCWFEDTVYGLASAIQHARTRPLQWTGIFNIGSDQPISMVTLATLVNRLAVELGLRGAPVAILHTEQSMYSQPFHDGWDRIPDLSRAFQILGFSCRVSLEDGLRRILIELRDRPGPSRIN